MVDPEIFLPSSLITLRDLVSVVSQYMAVCRRSPFWEGVGGNGTPSLGMVGVPDPPEMKDPGQSPPRLK